jgi:Pyruvate/2-oxoacid:ferredoxin oxidoreductase delta subunit
MAEQIVFCNCGGERISRERLLYIEDEITKTGSSFFKLSDLCGLSALQKDKINGIFSSSDSFLIIGCHPRTMKILLSGCGVDESVLNINYLNILETSEEELLKAISSRKNSAGDHGLKHELTTGTDWPSWYPVLDYSRCTACGQCADFCLFGVYDNNNGTVNVVNPQGCKNNCPACARICPHTAIIFPKYMEGGAIGGSEEIDELSEQTRQAGDIQKILDGDIYSALEQRKIKRRSIIRQEEIKKALNERKDALNNG